MNIVVTDGYTINPGDNPWNSVAALGELVVYDRSGPDQVIERSREAQIMVANTRIRLSGEAWAATAVLTVSISRLPVSGEFQSVMFQFMAQIR